jgi:hypothetical protein
MSLPDDDAEAASPVTRPRQADLSSAYEDAWVTWAADPETAAWDQAALDGLEPSGAATEKAAAGSLR